MYKRYLAVTLGLTSPLAAQAAVPEAITTALTAAGADTVTIAVAVLVVIVGIFAFKLMRRAL